MRITGLGTLCLAALACAGCVGTLFGKDDRPVAYRLEPPAVARAAAPLPLALGVSRPRAAESLDTERVAVVRPDGRFDYYAGVRWSEAAPEMLQPLLVSSLQSSGRYQAVLAVPSRAPTDLMLDVELRRFEAAYPTGGGAPRVRVEMLVTLVDTRRAQRLSSRLATAEVPAAANRRGEVVAAFERATADAVGQVVTWCATVAPQRTH